jgi:hypothetical protein
LLRVFSLRPQLSRALAGCTPGAATGPSSENDVVINKCNLIEINFF